MTMKDLFHSLFHPSEQYRKDKEAEHHRDALTRIQIREYDGALYVSFDNIPVIKIDDLKDGYASLPDMRMHYEKYMNESLV